MGVAQLAAALGITPEHVRHVMSGGKAGDSENSETGALVQVGWRPPPMP